MTILLLLLFISLPLTGLAQEDVTITLSDSSTVTHISTDLEHIVLERPVKNKRYKNFCIQERKSGKVLWESNTKVSGTPMTFLPQGLLCATIPNGFKKPYTRLYTLEGKMLQKYPYPIVYTDADKDIIIGYPKKQAVCYRLSTGEELWTADIPQNHIMGWNNIVRLDENHILFTAKDINKLNLLTGETITRKTKTEANDVDLMVARGLTGLLGALLTGAYSFPIGGDYIDDLQSNFLIQDNRIYHSDRTRMECFDMNLNEIWSCKFSSVKGTHAELRLLNDTLVLTADGMGKRFNQFTHCNSPFIASFNKNSGEMLKIDTLFIARDKEKFGKYPVIMLHPFYTFNESNKPTLITPGAKECLILDTEGNLHLVNKFLRSLRQYPQLETYIKGSSWKNYSIICRYGDHPDFYIIKDDNEVYMHLEPGYNQVSFKGNYLILESEDKVEFKLLKPE